MTRPTRRTAMIAKAGVLALFVALLLVPAGGGENPPVRRRPDLGIDD